MALYELLSKSDMVESKKVQYEDGTGWVVTSNSGSSGGSSSTTNSNIQTLNTSALEGLLKITDVLKESLTNINTGVSTYNYNNYNTYNYNSSNSSNSSSTTSEKNVNISPSHVLYPGIVGTLTTCSLLNNVPVNVIDGSKLTGDGATFFNSAKRWHTHTVYKSNNKSDGHIIDGIYELAYFDNTYFYKLPGSKPSSITYTNINNNFTIDNVYIGEKKSIPLTGWPPPYIVKPDIDGLSKGQIKFKSKTTYVYTYNLKSIIPNPLFNKYINGRYDDDQYATGDLNGEINTSYLKLNKDNLSNEIPKGHYIPGIGELGISMENIQIINDSIEALGGEYSNYKIPYDAIIASSTLYSATPITNSNYTIVNNINNVWAFNNDEAKISYMPISNKFTIIPFYRFENNVKINLEEDYDDIILNSIASIGNYDPNIYYELNSPITNYKTNITNINNFTINDWFEHPFNPKYFFNISFPEVRNYLTKNNNFINLHNDYLSYYEYYNKYVKDDNGNPIISYYEQSNSYYMDIENNSYKMNFIWNNGVSFPTYLMYNYTYNSYIPKEGTNMGYQKISYSSKYIKNEHKLISYSFVYFFPGPNWSGYDEYTTYQINYQLKTNTDDFWKQILMYNVPIYNNHLVLTPIYGSGEKTYNFKKNKTKTLFYVTLPIQCTNFECKMNNTTDCTISISKYLEIGGFIIYCINLSFKVDTPTDNVLIFTCNYQGKQIVKEYFYSIYSLLISNALYKDSSYTTYFGIENYYVAKDPYYWWKINQWDSLDQKNSMRITNVQYLKTFDKDYDPNSRMVLYTFTDSFGKLFDQSFIKGNLKFVAYLNNDNDTYYEVTHSSYTSNTYTYSKYNNSFKKLSNAYFNGMYDMSYLINTISRNMDIKENGTVSDRGLRVDRLIDNDILNNSNKYDILNIENDYGPYYLIKNHISENTNTYSLKYTNKYSYIYYSPKYELQYAIYNNSNNDYERRPQLKNNYHIFSINVNYFETTYSMPYWNLNTESGVLYYKPIVRINRTVDEFGIYNDLIFAYMPKYYKTSYEYTSNYISNGEAELTTLLLNINNQQQICKDVKVKDKMGKLQPFKIKFDPNGHLYPDNITPYLYNMKVPYYHRNNGSGDYLLDEKCGLMSAFNLNSKIKINIPIVGAKQSVCLAMDMMKYVHIGLFRKVITDENGRILSKNNRTITSCTGINNINNKLNTTFGNDYFERGFDEVINIRNENDVNEILKSTGWYYKITNSDMLQNIYWNMGNMYHNSFWFDYTYYYNYIFSDYIFLYNNINTTISVLISDPSLSLVSKQNAIIQLKPYELKVYYPSNFNYNDTSNFNKKKIYTIKIINKTSKVSFMKFEHYKLGEYNLSFEDMFDAFMSDNSDVINYFNTGKIRIPNSNEYPKFKLNGSMPDQLGYKLVTNLIGLYYNSDKVSHYTKDQILTLYNEIQKNGKRSINITGDNYSSLSKKIFEKLKDINDNKINVSSINYNTLNIDIKNYSENNSGHLIIIESELEKNFNDNKKKISIINNIGNYSTYSSAFDDDGNFIYEYDINGASESNIIDPGDDFFKI